MAKWHRLVIAASLASVPSTALAARNWVDIGVGWVWLDRNSVSHSNGLTYFSVAHGQDEGVPPPDYIETEPQAINCSTREVYQRDIDTDEFGVSYVAQSHDPVIRAVCQ